MDQDFPEGELSYYLAYFCRKQFDNEKDWTECRGRGVPPAPRSATLCEKEPCANYYFSAEYIFFLPNIKVLNKDAFSFVNKNAFQ